LDNGNYLQCYCPATGTDGIQTNWWLADSLSEEDRNYYVSMGWFLVNGEQWNLGNHWFLAKNMDAICALPSPTPTLTVTPTTTLTPTPTPKDEEPDEPRCDGLSASPSEGTAPLTVRFNANGYDPNGPVLEYEFDYGDSSGWQPQVWKTTEKESPHRYENPGEYVASVKIKDQGGRWRGGNDNCKKYIKVYAKPKVLGTGTPKGLPETGVGDIFGLFPFVTLPLGIYLTKRFKIN
jgi:hypothetical protein